MQFPLIHPYRVELRYHAFCTFFGDSFFLSTRTKVVECFGMTHKKHKDILYFVRTLSVVVGLVLIWRGIWHILDEVEKVYFGGELLWTGVFGVIIGVLLLYIPDHDLKEIEKL